jgi:leukotriene-A4 hydrolase
LTSTSKSREIVWPARPEDPHSFSEPDKILVYDVALDLKVDFERRVLQGTATLELYRNSKYPDAPLILDTRDLSIHSIIAETQDQELHEVKYAFGDSDAVLGTPLTIHLPPTVSSVKISYSTSPTATALQWLDAEQTAGKKAPFLFTQSQEIHARSWIPLQDTPGVRVTYTAHIEAPQGLLAVMSDGRRTNMSPEGWFQMSHPIPPYLIALAVGDIKFAPTGHRTGVYAEPPVLKAAQHEFGEADRMLEAAELLYGKYLWGRFDVLVLPPSFPFGGMENPGVAFVTPTLIAGDRSSVSVIAHELAHAWSGNLVTNATWSDYWLNEGFTTYTERRIQEELYGSSRAAMEEVLAEERLAKEMQDLPPEDQLLHPDLYGRDPECIGTLVPYVKGALFLKTLENTFGRDRFDAFLRSYFEHFAFESITTAEAISYLKTTLLDKYPDLAAQIPLEEWLYEPGLPASAPKAVSPVLNETRKFAQAWSANRVSLDRVPDHNWNTQQRLYFLDSLPPNIGFNKMSELDQRFDVTGSNNAEIIYRWLLLAIRNGYDPAYQRLQKFLMTVGRIIYVKPLYEELAKTADGKAFAKDIYAKARSSYHPLTQAIVDKILVR